MMVDQLQFHLDCPVKAQNAGLFISRGGAKPPTRIINSHELIYVIQGKLDLWEMDQDFHLVAGMALHLWPGREHGSSRPMPPDLKFYWIHFEIINTCIRQPTDKENLLLPSISVPQAVHLTHPETLERLFRIFLSEQETGILLPATANLLIALMLLEVSQQARRQNVNKGDNMEEDLNVVATWAHTYIRMNFDRPITASEVAEAVGYNVDYLGRIYRQAYHCTLTQAIHRRRITKAREYLRNSSMTINQIAANCGFKDPDYFRRIFKRYTQISPSDYRDENSLMHVITH